MASSLTYSATCKSHLSPSSLLPKELNPSSHFPSNFLRFASHPASSITRPSSSISCSITKEPASVLPKEQNGSARLQRPDSFGRFGKFGGKYVPETLMYALTELETAFHALSADEDFQVLEFFHLYFFLGSEKLVSSNSFHLIGLIFPFLANILMRHRNELMNTTLGFPFFFLGILDCALCFDMEFYLLNLICLVLLLKLALGLIGKYCVSFCSSFCRVFNFWYLNIDVKFRIFLLLRAM